MSLTQFGEVTKTIFLKQIQSHKLHHEFEVAAAVSIKKGQAVVLNALGQVAPAAAAAEAYTIIGYSVHNGAAGELVTIGMKAFCIVWAQSLGALVSGPVEVGAAPTDPTFGGYIAATVVGKATGWALDPASGADELVRVALV